jgi:nucleoside 2-deoxyribosyltransferase
MEAFVKDSKNKKKIYIAAPLFSQAEQAFNRQVKERLHETFEVFLPQEDGGLIVDYIDKGIPLNYAYEAVFRTDTNALDSCDLVVIILDGRSIDEGACFELGYAYAKDKPCYGLQTDPRRLLTYGNNPMIECSCQEVFVELDKLVDWLLENYAITSEDTPNNNVRVEGTR